MAPSLGQESTHVLLEHLFAGRRIRLDLRLLAFQQLPALIAPRCAADTFKSPRVCPRPVCDACAVTAQTHECGRTQASQSSASSCVLIPQHLNKPSSLRFGCKNSGTRCKEAAMCSIDSFFYNLPEVNPSGSSSTKTCKRAFISGL